MFHVSFRSGGFGEANAKRSESHFSFAVSEIVTRSSKGHILRIEGNYENLIQFSPHPSLNLSYITKKETAAPSEPKKEISFQTINEYLRKCSATPVPHPNEMIHLPDSEFRLTRPLKDEEEVLIFPFSMKLSHSMILANSLKVMTSFWCLPIVSRILSVGNLLMILSAVILEKRIVIFGPSHHVVSAVTYD